MYNVKLIEYPNESAQIRIYDTCIGIDSADTRVQAEFEVEPFTHKKVRVVDEFRETDKEESLRRSLAHTKSMISKYARCNYWEWFVTFTYDKTKTDRTDFKECMAKVRNWLKNARRKAPNLAYLVVPELHADKESWHCHLLLSNIGELEFVKSGRRKKYKDIYNVAGWSWGFSTATQIEDTKRVSKYILKYITKDAHALQKGAHRYYVSQNLELPEEKVFLIPENEQSEFLKELIDSLGLEITWDKTKQNDYTSVRYIELE